MLDEERLKIIQEMKDRTFSIYDSFRFDSTAKEGKSTHESFKKLKELMSMLDMLVQDYVETIPDFFQIIATEDTIINNEEMVEVKTNATGLPVGAGEIEIMFDGCIPSAGYLKLHTELSLDGIKFYVKNEVPQKVWDDHDLCGYHYCEPTTTRYFSPGVYRIEKGQVIGIGIKNKEKKYTLLEVSQICGLSYEEAVSEVCDCDLLYGKKCDFHFNPNMKCTLSKWQELSTEGDQYGVSKVSKLIPKHENGQPRVFNKAKDYKK